MRTFLSSVGCRTQDERIDLMRRHLAIFGAGSISWLFADREFSSHAWMEFLLENNIIFAIRLRESAVVHLQDGHTYHLGSLLRTRRMAKQILNQPGRFEAMTDRSDWPLTFIAKRLSEDEFLILATNVPADAALKTYRKQWQIECLFEASKTRGLDMEDTRITDPQHLSTLLVIVTRAMTWAHVTAIAAQAGGGGSDDARVYMDCAPGLTLTGRAGHAADPRAVTQTKQSQAAITPEIALQKLKDGNTRFVEGRMRKRNLLAQVTATSGEQFPCAAIVGCIDSREAVQVTFDKGNGDVFSATVAGNFVNDDILDSLEFACPIAGAMYYVTREK